MREVSLTGVDLKKRPATAPNGAAAPSAMGFFGNRPLIRRIASFDTIWIFLVLVALGAAFALARPSSFGSLFNIRNIVTDAATLLVMAVGMTFVIITAGIDLSVGSVLVFAGVVAAKTIVALGGMEASWAAIAVGFAAGLLAGLGWGLLNGYLIAVARLPALIVTLATMGAALGAAQLLTDGVDVRGVPPKLTQLGLGMVGGVPFLVILAAFITVLAGLVLRFTRFGRHTYAVGSNAESARRAGIDVERHLLKVYALQGLLAGIAGLMSLARFSTTTIAGHSADNLNVIAAVVLGGTSLFGGSGTIFGTTVGIFIPAVLQNGFIIIGVQAFWQSIAVSTVLIAAVYIDHRRRRVRGQR